MRIFFPFSSLNETIYAGCGAILFSIYIIADTQEIVKYSGNDEYVEASLQIYMDVMNLFLEFLKLLRNRN
jgi:FtsH-binding integral membrane protein